jgi:hypothetical protein
LIIDLGKKVEIVGFSYTPRQGAEGVTGALSSIGFTWVMSWSRKIELVDALLSQESIRQRLVSSISAKTHYD